MRLAKSLSALLVVLLFKSASAQELTLKDVLNGRIFATSIQAQTLDSRWYKIRVSGEEVKLAAMLRPGPRDSEKPRSAWFYTQGNIVTIDRHKYLVAYHAVAPPPRDEDEEDIPFNDRFQMELYGRRYNQQGDLMPDARLKREATLTLSLLDLKTCGNMEDIQPFDAARELEKILSPQEKAQAELQVANRRSERNLKQVGLALMQYVQDYDEKLPPMRTVYSGQQLMSIVQPRTTPRYDMSKASVQEVLQPYARSIEIFMHPVTHEIYRPNPRISRMDINRIDSPHEVVTFYEARPGKDGTRAVAFLDGHVTRMSEADWQRLRRTAKIPP